MLMKKKVIRISVAFLLFAAFAFVGCKKEAIIETIQENATGAKALTTYSVTPSLNTFTAISSGNIVGSCGTFQGGIVKAKVTAFSGSNVTVTLYTTNGLSFPAGYFYLKSGSACGAILGTMIGNTGLNAVSINLNVSPLLLRGLLHLFPVYITSLGQRYWSEPILISTNPVMNSGTTDGFLYGTVNGVDVLCSGTSPSGTNVNSSSVNQCTQFCKRYYSTVYGMNIWLTSGTVSCGSTINAACNWYSTASARGLTAYLNGSAPPRVGDILVFENGGNGHVMIITEVKTNEISVAHQNGGTNTAPIGGIFSRNGNTIVPWSHYTCKGWLRKT